MKINETLWAAVYKDKPEIIINQILSVSREHLLERLNFIGHEKSEYSLIRVRVIPVKGAKKR